MTKPPPSQTTTGPERSLSQRPGSASDRSYAAVQSHHRALAADFAAERDRLTKVEQRYSLVRLLLFLAAAVGLAVGAYDQQLLWTLVGGLCVVGFAVAVMRHLGVLKLREAAETRLGVHERHLLRVARNLGELPASAAEQASPMGHAYAWDIDLSGRASLLRLLDVTHTQQGREILLSWLSQGADAETLTRRQAAVQELRHAETFRQELESGALLSSTKGLDLDGRSFAKLAQLPSLFEERPWLTPVIFILPVLTLGTYVLAQLGLLPPTAWALPLALQAGLTLSHQKRVAQAFNLGSARQSVVEAFERMLVTVEHAEVSAPFLRDLKADLMAGERPPSTQMARLRKWVSLGELRQQALLWIVINPLSLWDLHVLRGLERWNREAGARTQRWFEVLGTLEALSSLATLLAVDPDATMPDIGDAKAPLEVEGLSHPLLPPTSRVENDLCLGGPGSALLVTGSNMAGKSTLLRAVGLNVALGLAGGPVTARRMSVPQVRLRASMRAQDALDEGSSYFHAELQKLKMVVAEADASPPVLFLLDELLRGTNERARHVGAKAVLMHMLARGATGLVATHDVSLAKGAEGDSRLQNVHFTDVVIDGEMTFDYRLQPGVVRTSNALRLLAMAGIDVPESERRAMESVEP